MNDEMFDLEPDVPEALSGIASKRDSAEDDLLATENVVGVGLGFKITGGTQTDKPSVMVLVEQKLPAEMLSGKGVPKTVGGAPTDVLEVGPLVAGGDAEPAMEAGVQKLAKRVRPVRPGYSIGHLKVTAGTLGAGAYDLRNTVPGKPPRYYALSNNHVLANSNDARIGDPIIQPGAYDGGTYPADVVGRLARYVPIRFDGTVNYVDAAIAEIPFDTIDRDIYWSGYPRSLVKAAEVGMLVKKTGRTTHFTTGRVTALNATVNVNYGGGKVAKFGKQIVTSDMSAGGDSGSLVLDLDNNPVGLLFAGSSTATIINPIAYVQILLGVRIWP
ncbi:MULTISPECIES: S1 family peptidase [Isoptericola]|nr:MULTISPECIES: S1 family peptidase [Isoptericola]MDO8145304.1 S1 family peptidase [Isoptericola sp. 178]MDO8151115.1 S1 family peptidase [Isoptericola sp. b408]